MAKNEKTMNGMVRYFGELKKKHQEAILLFRCGDFYEAYGDDAEVVSDVCGVALTRENGNGGYMCGFPHHALDTYLPKLIRSGKRVAICDQLEPPKPKPKPRITEIVNPNDNQNQNQKEETTMATKKSTKNESVNKSAAQFSVITYTTKKGGTAPQIIGFTGEDDPHWKAVKESGVKWASASYRKDISGEKVYLLMFGTKYMQAAQQLCDAYNSGDAKQIAEAQAACQAIYEQAQAEGKARWEAKKAEWAEKKSSKVQDVQGVQDPQPSAVSPQTSEEPRYSIQDVAAMLNDVLAGKDVPQEIKKLLVEAA